MEGIVNVAMNAARNTIADIHCLIYTCPTPGITNDRRTASQGSRAFFGWEGDPFREALDAHTYASYRFHSQRITIAKIQAREILRSPPSLNNVQDPIAVRIRVHMSIATPRAGLPG
jgi:hypothetical protein